MALISENLELLELALTLIQSGFFKTYRIGIILIGIRDVLSADFCFLVGS
jgi:hypothetical protein